MRAKPRPPERDPFGNYERPKHWHAAESDAICRHARMRVDPTARINVNVFLAILAWHHGGIQRTPEEELFFGKTPPRLADRYAENPFFRLIKKEPFTGATFAQPVKLR